MALQHETRQEATTQRALRFPHRTSVASMRAELDGKTAAGRVKFQVEAHYSPQGAFPAEPPCRAWALSDSNLGGLSMRVCCVDTVSGTPAE